ncbi:MAG TPA: FAD-dependent oxidoreductase [Gemmatimonadaceae bacterium]|nr:FAD-dependent oxidoreductase [Gemmatimonadaceae bacterium]
MAKPILLSVDDDPEVSRAVERDLRRKFGGDYRVMRAESGPAALDALEKLTLRGDQVALLLVDQRMPVMTGVEFLERALKIYPKAKRVLLTAYADTDAAIRAINSVRIDYYLIKPWDPPEQNLYPFLTDLLEDWKGANRPAFDGIRVIGHRWSPQSHALREFLGRNLIPYQWIDLDASSEGASLVERAAQAAGGERPKLPLVLFADGVQLGDPDPTAVAEKVGLKTRAEKPFYDLAVVGAGPAGLAAAVYGASEGLKTIIVEREAPGGQAGTSSRIENYLGFPAGLSGADLTRRGVAQARKFGAEILNPQEVKQVRIEGQYRVLTLGDGSEISARVVVVATGVSYRMLDIPGAEALTGAGMYYGASTAEAINCRDEDVYIVGGGNSAGQAAMFFAQFARQVTILVRGGGLGATMSQYLVDQIAATPNIRVEPRTQVVSVTGNDHLECITVECADQQRQVRQTNSLFVFIGAAPRTDFLGDTVMRDKNGFIMTGPDLIVDGKRPPGWPLDRDPFLLEASVPGIFCAGDVRHQSIKRVASAVGEGSIAVQFTHQYLAQA